MGHMGVTGIMWGYRVCTGCILGYPGAIWGFGFRDAEESNGKKKRGHAMDTWITHGDICRRFSTQQDLDRSYLFVEEDLRNS